MNPEGFSQVNSYEFSDQKRNTILKGRYLVRRRTIIIFLNIFGFLAIGVIGAGLGIGFSSSSKKLMHQKHLFHIKDFKNKNLWLN